MKQTPTPWTIEHYTGHPHIEIYGKIEGSTIPARICYMPDHHGEAASNAAFIVRACNSHGELVDACKLAEDALDIASNEHPTFIKIRNQLRAAIAKAEEE